MNAFVIELPLEYISSLIIESQTGYIALILFISSILTKSNNNSLFLAWSFNFIAVFFHELAHTVVGFFTYSKPKKFSIFPKKIVTEHGIIYLLGRIEHDNLRWYNIFPTQMAPVLLFYVAYMLETHFWTYFEKTFINTLLFLYLMIIFIVNAIPSYYDFITAFSNPFSVILWCLILAITYCSINYL